ncbi:MAG: tetratricopeptide repeat protein [Verrucomicrobia bacterium]|nr:tetratricopeptide repeat protein [Verrucomicrobiota bacterium]
MKFFRKKDSHPAEPRIVKTDSAPGQSFYSQYAGEAPLDEYSDTRGPQQTRQTSRHSPAHRREVSNRAGSWAIAFLLLRAVLIVVLLVGGFIVLKLVLTRLNKPSEKEQQVWAANAARMGKAEISVTATAAAISQELAVSPAMIEQRLGQWEQAERLVRSAEALTRRGINEEAVQRLGQALRIAPNNREALLLLIDTYMQLGLYAEAVPLCIRQLDQNSRQPELQMKLLRALQSSGQIDAGLMLANRMLLDQPNNEAVLSIAAAGQIGLGNTDAALAMFKKMLENNDHNIAALQNCGKIYFDRRDYEAAIPYYLELVRLDSKPDYYQMLARAYAQQDQASRAVVFMGQASSLFGGNAVSPWLRDAQFDPIRESVEFRSFADRIVGVETRKAIEAISRRETGKTTSDQSLPDAPKRPDSEMLLRKR